MSETSPFSTMSVLAKIDAWYLLNVPAIHATLHSGATDAELDAVEREIGFKLPAAFRSLYKWHDGQTWKVGGIFGLEFMPLKTVLSTWLDNQVGEDMGYRDTIHPPHSTQDAYWTPGWLAFLRKRFHADFIGLDFNPGPTGTNGQIINFGHDQGHRFVLANSLKDFLAKYWSMLELENATVAHTLDHRHFEDEYAEEYWYVGLHDGAGSYRDMDRVTTLSDLFPGFGATPVTFDRHDE